MDRPATAEELFDAIGSAYEDAFGRPPVIDKAVRHLLDALPPSSRVLDIGSGTGRPVAQWTSAPESWEAVCAFFPFLQMPREDTEAVLADIARWLVPGGFFALVTVPLDAENVPVEFFGRTIHATSFAPDDLVRRVEAAGLEVTGTHAEIFTADEPGTPPEEHLLINARRPV